MVNNTNNIRHNSNGYSLLVVKKCLKLILLPTIAFITVTRCSDSTNSNNKLVCVEYGTKNTQFVDQSTFSSSEELLLFFHVINKSDGELQWLHRNSEMPFVIMDDKNNVLGTPYGRIYCNDIPWIPISAQDTLRIGLTWESERWRGDGPYQFNDFCGENLQERLLQGRYTSRLRDDLMFRENDNSEVFTESIDVVLEFTIE